MTVFADTSAVVKRYAEESGSEQVRGQGTFVVSALARVEVVAALWRKHRMGELTVEDAGILVADFEREWHAPSGPFAAVSVRAELLEVASGLAGTRGLRAYDSIQLASALAARSADQSVDTFACYDRDLRAAAVVEGFTLQPFQLAG